MPSHSWCAWPSFMTGLNPAGHGVFDILEHKPGASKRLPVTYRSIKARTVFADLNAAGKTTLALNIPLTFPTPAIKGKVIGGGVLPASRSYTHPVELQQELDDTAPFPVNTFQELYSLTFTYNYAPIPNLIVRPELHWDHSTLNTAFDGDENDQVTIACGAAYTF